MSSERVFVQHPAKPNLQPKQNQKFTAFLTAKERPFLISEFTRLSNVHNINKFAQWAYKVRLGFSGAMDILKPRTTGAANKHYISDIRNIRFQLTLTLG